MVRYIQSRTVSSDNNHYAAIFHTKGYVENPSGYRRIKCSTLKASSTIGGRGFWGAVVLTGKRFSGKSFFGEMVLQPLFQKMPFGFYPGSVLQLQGRKLEMEYDLEAVLEFIRKNTLNQHPLVWIDDLELWWSPTVPLNQNVGRCAAILTPIPSNIFFLVSPE